MRYICISRNYGSAYIHICFNTCTIIYAIDVMCVCTNKARHPAHTDNAQLQSFPFAIAIRRTRDSFDAFDAFVLHILRLTSSFVIGLFGNQGKRIVPLFASAQTHWVQRSRDRPWSNAVQLDPGILYPCGVCVPWTCPRHPQNPLDSEGEKPAGRFRTRSPPLAGCTQPLEVEFAVVNRLRLANLCVGLVPFGKGFGTER